MSSSKSRIAQLSAIISDNTQQIDKFLAEKQLPYPSFDSNAPVQLGLPLNLEQARSVVLQATQELNDLLQEPRDLIFNHYHNTIVHLHAISKFALAHKIPVDGDISFSDLASSIGINQSPLTQILRLAIAHRVFLEPRPGFVAHSAASRQIAEDSRIASWVGACVDEMWPAALNVVPALEKWPEAEESNQTGFSLANKTDQSFYDVLSQSPERARQFGEAMSFFTTGEEYALHHLTSGYPWAEVPAGTVVDLGGSHGDAAFALARKHTHLKVIVQDLPQVVANSFPEEGLDVSFMAHDFFKEQPVKGAEVYLYRWTLHNWPDKYCVKILKALVPALKKGARILIMDMVMPPPGVLPNNVERKLRAIDLTMLEIGNAKDRDLGEWQQLFKQADERFIFMGLKMPPGSNLSIIEASWDIPNEL